MALTLLRVVLIAITIPSIKCFVPTGLGLSPKCFKAGPKNAKMCTPVTRGAILKNTRAALTVVVGVALPNMPTFAAAEKKSKPKVYETKGGVKFIVLKEGTGPVARDGDYCVVEFTGFLPDGQVFDASNAPGRKPIAFKLGARQVIKGWEEVLRLMNAGAEVQMVVPPAMAFGDKGICIDNGECLVKPGMEVRYDLQLKRVAVSP